MDPFRLTVNGQHEIMLQPDDAAALDCIPDGPGRFHILEDGRAYRVEVVSADPEKHTYTLRVNGKLQTVRLTDAYERLVEQLGLKAGGSQKQNTIKAPMPGLVLSVLVAPGQTVQKGDPLLILEAMKMENVLKAGSDGVVKTIAVQKGAPVEKGQLLIELA